MSISILLLLVTLLAEKDKRSPLAVFCIAWVACMLPSELGIIQYNFIPLDRLAFSATFFTYNALFVIGYKVAVSTSANRKTRADPESDFKRRGEARFVDLAALVSLFGAVLLIIDLRFFQGIVVDNLDSFAQVRQSFAARQVNWMTQYGSVMTWGALYVLSYLVVEQSSLSFWKKALYLAPVLGIGYTGLLSAGRQVAFQLFVIIVVSLMYRHKIARQAWRMSLRWKVFMAAFALSSILYMGLIAHKRNDEEISVNKSDVLANLFDFSLNPAIERLLDNAGPAIKDGVVEGIVYFSSPVNLFAVFIPIPKPNLYFGVETLPLIARRLESVTGRNVSAVMEEHVQIMDNAGVIGVGWSTSYTSFILDFGVIGAGLLVSLIGFLCGKAWKTFIAERTFSAMMLVVSACLVIVYMPLIPATSDTNILLLTVASIIGWSRSRVRSRRIPQDSPVGAVPAKLFRRPAL